MLKIGKLTDLVSRVSVSGCPFECSRSGIHELVAACIEVDVEYGEKPSNKSFSPVIACMG